MPAEEPREPLRLSVRARSRKFILAVFFALTGAVALFTGHLSGAEFIGLTGLVIGLYGGANVMEERR